MSAFMRLLHELVLLVARIGRVPRSVWGSVAIAMVASWVAYFGTILIATEVVSVTPWLLIGCLSLGLVAQLSAVVYALRVLLGSRAAFGRLLAETMLAFLSMYWAFGFVDSNLHDVMDVISARLGFFSFADAVGAMNPLSSPLVLVLVLVALVGSFLLRRWLEWLFDRTGRSVIGVASALVEAVFLFLLGVSGFRIITWVLLWLGNRNLASWLDAALEQIKAVIHIDLPEIFTTFWDVVAVPLANMVFLPIAWLALAGVVAGVKAPNLAELWSAERSRAGVLRKASLAVVDAFYNDIDDKVLPFVYSLRRVLKAGWALLGGYVLLFFALHQIGGSIDNWIEALIMGSGANQLLMFPFGDFVDQVVVTGLQLVLLAAAFQRVEELRSEPTPSPVPNWSCALWVVAVLTAVTCVQALTVGLDGAQRVAAGTTVRVGRSEVLVSEVRVGDEFVSGNNVERSSQTFVVVKVSVFNAYPARSVELSLLAGGASYQPWDGYTYLSSTPGFRSTRDVIFEVERSGLAGGVSIRVESAEYAAEFALSGLSPSPTIAVDTTGVRTAP
ncbi:MAG: hypothetical protein LBK28_00515 [Propionibacteriaceae bacterium]|jgi:hypothetical protein|nr:hypothetical protein [Propionibacteriaceae bacterium]